MNGEFADAATGRGINFLKVGVLLMTQILMAGVPV